MIVFTIAAKLRVPTCEYAGFDIDDGEAFPLLKRSNSAYP